MSQEHVEVVRREYVAMAARDWAALRNIWHPDIEYDVVSGAGTFRGIDQVTGFFDSYSELYSDFQVEAEEIMDAGDHVVAVERLSGHGLMGSEIAGSIHERFVRVIAFKDGKIWRAKEYSTLAEALEAVGLSE
jgi:ketosteroid isomerase-like protein